MYENRIRNKAAHEISDGIRALSGVNAKYAKGNRLPKRSAEQ